MLKYPIHKLTSKIITNNFYARLSLHDKDLLDSSCSGSFTKMKEEAKWDLLDRIQENTEGWENDKGRKSGINYDYECIKTLTKIDYFHDATVVSGVDSQTVANLYKVFASYYDIPKGEWSNYHAPYKDIVSSVPSNVVEVSTTDGVLPEPYIEKMSFPAKVKEHSILSNVVSKNKKKVSEPDEQINVEPAVAIVKELVTKIVEDEHIVFGEDASNIVSHPNKPKQASVPMLSVKIGDHCYYGLCDIGASVSAIPDGVYFTRSLGNPKRKV